MVNARDAATWKNNQLYLSTRLSGYSIVAEDRWPGMWRVQRPDGTFSDMVNHARAKDAAFDMLDRDLKGVSSPREGST